MLYSNLFKYVNAFNDLVQFSDRNKQLLLVSKSFLQLYVVAVVLENFYMRTKKYPTI